MSAENVTNEEDLFVNVNCHKEPLRISSDTLDFVSSLCKNFILFLLIRKFIYLACCYITKWYIILYCCTVYHFATDYIVILQKYTCNLCLFHIFFINFVNCFCSCWWFATSPFWRVTSNICRWKSWSWKVHGVCLQFGEWLYWSQIIKQCCCWWHTLWYCVISMLIKDWSDIGTKPFWVCEGV